MAKHVIFLVHGMGDFSDKWSTSVQKQIADSYSSYGIAKTLPFNDFFRFEETVDGQARRQRERMPPLHQCEARLGSLSQAEGIQAARRLAGRRHPQGGALRPHHDQCVSAQEHPRLQPLSLEPQGSRPVVPTASANRRGHLGRRVEHGVRAIRVGHSAWSVRGPAAVLEEVPDRRRSDLGADHFGVRRLRRHRREVPTGRLMCH